MQSPQIYGPPPEAVAKLGAFLRELCVNVLLPRAQLPSQVSQRPTLPPKSITRPENSVVDPRVIKSAIPVRHMPHPKIQRERMPVVAKKLHASTHFKREIEPRRPVHRLIMRRRQKPSIRHQERLHPLPFCKSKPQPQRADPTVRLEAI